MSPDREPDIVSPSNPRVKWVASLRKHRNRVREGLCLVDGYDELSLAARSGATLRTVLFCPTLSGGSPEADGHRLQRFLDAQTEVLTLGRAAFEKVAYREAPDGWLGVIPVPGCSLAEVDVSESPLMLVAESVEKPGNLGAILRTADAAGVRAVVAASPATDWGNPNVIRASRGTVFAVPVATAPSVEVATWLVRKGVNPVVATPDADRLASDVDLTGPTAILVGAEHAGVSPLWSDRGAVGARLPMVGRVNSLNVATAAAVFLYEALRQRGTAQPG